MYFELLDKGIRDVCMPDYGVFNKRDLDFVDKEARKHGLRTLLATFNRIGNKGNKFKSYQRIIFAKEAKDKAKRIRRLITKTNKTKDDTIRLGRLFGYREDKIYEFVYKPGRKHERKAKKQNSSC